MNMDINIENKKDNPLLGRMEIQVNISHPNEKIPKRDAVVKAISEEMKADKKLVIVDNIKSSFGIAVSRAYVKIYKDMEILKKIEPNFIQKRHGLIDEVKK